MSEIQYLDYEGLLRYHELIDAQKANKTEISDVVRYSSQSLTNEQKAQARTNIGAGTLSSLNHTITVKSGKKSDGSTDISATSSSAASPTVTLAASGVTASGYGDTTALTPAYGTTFKVPYIKVNEQGIVVDASEHTVTIPASDNTNTATAADNILDGSNSGTQITYAPYTAQLSKLSFDTSTTAPTRTDRLNLNGYLYATKLYSGGTEVLTSHLSLADYAPKASPALTGTPTAPTATAGTNTTQIATTAFVQTAISGIADAMVFIGTVGKATNGSGTVTAIPTSNVKIGHTYKIVDENKSIAAANSATGSAVTAKVGDTIVATDTTPKWVVIPSGDEPNGTVTSVKILATAPIAIDNNAAITSSGTRTITHATSGVTANSYGPTANATASNGTVIKVPQITVDSYGHVTSVVERSITALNSTYTVNDGAFSIKGAGTVVGSTSANASGDSAVDIVAGSNITVTPDATNNKITIASSYTDTNQKVKAGSVTFGNNDVIDITAGSNVTVTGDASGKTITIAATDTTYDVASTTANGLAPKLVTGGANLNAASTDYVLSYVSGGTAPVWRKLPANAYNDHTYTGYNIAFQNNAGTTVDTYKALTSPNKNFKAGANVEMTASSNTITISASMPVITYGSGSTLDSTKQIDALFITT